MLEPNRWAWRPQAGPQKALVDCPLKEIFFGGTRGGGKTDGVLGKWALATRPAHGPLSLVARSCRFRMSALRSQFEIRTVGIEPNGR
jgi:hypothetical protein